MIYYCARVSTEAFTGKTMERPQFQQLQKKIHPGDTLVGTKLDRFARSAIDGITTVQDLFNRSMRVNILNMGLVENPLTGNLILTVMLTFAKYERGVIVERTQTGKAVARKNLNFLDEN